MGKVTVSATVADPDLIAQRTREVQAVPCHKMTSREIAIEWSRERS